MDNLKLAALDADDLKVLAAHAQDAVGKVGDIVWRPKEKRLTLELNRFAWEKSSGKKAFERHRAVLHFARVLAVQSHLVRREAPDAVVSLLTIHDLMHEGQKIISVSYRSLEVYLAIAVVYFILTGATTLALRRIEQRLRAGGMVQ